MKTFINKSTKHLLYTSLSIILLTVGCNSLDNSLIARMETQKTQEMTERLMDNYKNTDQISINERNKEIAEIAARQACKLAYRFHNEKRISPETEDEGWEFQPFFGEVGSKTMMGQVMSITYLGFVGLNTKKKILSIIFRGTQELVEWLNNLNPNLEERDKNPHLKKFGRIHGGYSNIFESLVKGYSNKTGNTKSAPGLVLFGDIEIDNLNYVLKTKTDLIKSKKESGYSVIIAGHSLGGGLATIAAAYFSKKYLTEQDLFTSKEDVHLFTYGSPFSGTRKPCSECCNPCFDCCFSSNKRWSFKEEMNNSLSEENIHRYQRQGDIVPKQIFPLKGGCVRYCCCCYYPKCYPCICPEAVGKAIVLKNPICCACTCGGRPCSKGCGIPDWCLIPCAMPINCCNSVFCYKGCCSCGKASLHAHSTEEYQKEAIARENDPNNYNTNSCMIL